MTNEIEKNTFEYLDLFRGFIESDSYLPAALLVAETKEEYFDKNIYDDSEERIYETIAVLSLMRAEKAIIT
jgi:hypothetical protein